MSIPEIKIFSIYYKPSYSDLSHYCTHSCNPEFIEEVVFKYQVSSEYPQSYLKQFQLTYSSKLVEINGEKVHLVIMMTPKSFKFEMYTFPDNEVGIAWFERIFTFLVDYSTGHWKESADVKN